MTPESGSAKYQATIVFHKDLTDFLQKNPGHRYRVPRGDEQRLKSGLSVGSFEVEHRADGTQVFEVWRSVHPEAFVIGWYEASEKEFSPRRFLAFHPGSRGNSWTRNFAEAAARASAARRPPTSTSSSAGTGCVRSAAPRRDPARAMPCGRTCIRRGAVVDASERFVDEAADYGTRSGRRRRRGCRHRRLRDPLVTPTSAAWGSRVRSHSGPARAHRLTPGGDVHPRLARSSARSAVVAASSTSTASPLNTTP